MDSQQALKAFKAVKRHIGKEEYKKHFTSSRRTANFQTLLWSDEMKRVLGKSAASVGLKLPDEVYQP
ncbi:hypothetical protein V6N11_045582 [Hibiscus sabdariffa]|uniref:Uncharacterized protein n=1 Tax=Hibiscus sabdariffa TaxID=183260 RepID=A0ABR2Q1D0_9ROSI